MRWLALWLLSALAVSSAGCAHFTGLTPVPEPYLERFARHPYWLSVAVLEGGKAAFPPSEVAAVKKWAVVENGGRPVALEELATSSFLGLFRRLRAGEPLSAHVALGDGLAPEPFLAYPLQAAGLVQPFARDRYALRDLGGDRFAVKVNEGRLTLVFAPAPNDYAAPRGPDPEAGGDGIWTAPFGAESEIVDQVRRAARQQQGGSATEGEAGDAEMPPDGPYLHHDLTVRRRVRVLVDRSLPAAFRPSLASALARWNRALGRDQYQLVPGERVVDLADCVTGFTVCIRWVGPPDVSFTGVDGFTNLGFDPQTGLLTGAVISLVNDDVTPPLRPMRPADRARVDAPDWDWLAEAMHRYAEMGAVTHPEAGRYVEYVLLHELGHATGFGHNFFASGKTTPGRPTTSVMTYPPFPVGHLAAYLGPADLARVALVYGAKPGSSALAATDYCSTFDALVPHQDDAGLYHKPAGCDLYVVGDPADWYLALARHGRDGIFTGYPDLSHLEPEVREVYEEAAARRKLPPLNLLSRLGYLLADRDPRGEGARERLRAYLCGLPAEKRAKAAAQLKEFHEVELRCAK